MWRRHPPLHKTQGRGTHSLELRINPAEGWVTRPIGHRLKNKKLSSQKIANMAKARKRCSQGPPSAGLFPALICLIFLTRRIFPTAKHVPLPTRNTGSGVLPGSVYPAKTMPPSIPSSMNRIVDFFTRKLLLRTHAAEKSLLIAGPGSRTRRRLGSRRRRGRWWPRNYRLYRGDGPRHSISGACETASHFSWIRHSLTRRKIHACLHDGCQIRCLRSFFH